VREKFDDILDKAIELLGSEVELEDFLKRYPEVRAELLPLLDAVRFVSQTEIPTISQGGKERIRVRLLASLQKAYRSRWASVPRWAKRVSLSFSAFLLLGTGVAAAAGRSVPGGALYPVKRAAERVQLAVASSSEAKARLRLLYAERRVDESRAVVDHPEALRRVISEMDSDLSAAEENASRLSQEKREDLMAELLALTERQEEVLEGVAASAPESARKAIDRAVKNSRRGHDRAVDLLAGGPEESAAEAPSPPVFRQKQRGTPSPPPAADAPEDKPEPSRSEDRSGKEADEEQLGR
jgi:hypothetical protein